jgi:hypothetical protein
VSQSIPEATDEMQDDTGLWRGNSIKVALDASQLLGLRPN